MPDNDLGKGRKKLDYISSLYMGDHLFIVSMKVLCFRAKQMPSAPVETQYRSGSSFSTQVGTWYTSYEEVGDYGWYSVSHSG